MAKERHIPPRNHGRKEASTPMEYGAPPEILPIEIAFNFPLFPSPFIFTSLWLFFGTLTSLLIIFFGTVGVLFEQALLQWLFQYLFKPRGAGTFFYSFKFYGGTFRLCCVITTKRLLPQSGRTPPRVMTPVHKMDGHNQGQTYTSSRNGRTQPGSQTYTSPKNGRTQPGSQTYTSPQSGQTPPRVMTPNRIMDGPNHVNNLYISTTWTDPTTVKTQVHDVDG